MKDNAHARTTGEVANLYQRGFYLIFMSLRVVPLVEHASERISFKEQHTILSFLSRENRQGLQNQRILHSFINM